MRNMKLSFMLLNTICLAALLNGCGSSSKNGTVDDVSKVNDATCAAVACHGNQASRITNQGIIATYQQSQHAKTSIYSGGVGCQDCHGGGSMHFGKGPLPYPNPAAEGKCQTCHQAHLPAGHYNALAPAADAVSPAMYLATNTKNCNNCHNPHNPNPTDTHTAYAESGHGDVNGVAWASEDFKENSSCIRCHTTTGYVNYVTHFTAPTAGFGAAGDATREVLACNACHTSYDFKNSVRSVGAFTTPYTANGGSNLIPDVGESNLCIPCHTGRASQADILALSDAAMSNTSFKNPHYMPAAGIMYLKTGFINFTSAVTQAGSTYMKSYSLPLAGVNAAGYPLSGGVDAKYGGITGGLTSTHRALGTPTVRGRETWMQFGTTIQGPFETKGPCVTCHINSDITKMPAFTGDTTQSPFLDTVKYGAIPTTRSASGHNLSATSFDANKQSCIPCHNDEGGLDNPANAGEEKLIEAKPYFQGGLAVIASLFSTKYNITFDNASYPYFYEKGTTTAVKDWTRSGTLTPAKARKLMGAAYNLKMLSADAGAYVHGRSYSQRLIFDSIDFLNDGIMNANAADTIVALGDPVLFPSKVADHWLFKAAGARK